MKTFFQRSARFSIKASGSVLVHKQAEPLYREVPVASPVARLIVRTLAGLAVSVNVCRIIDTARIIVYIYVTCAEVNFRAGMGGLGVYNI